MIPSSSSGDDIDAGDLTSRVCHGDALASGAKGCSYFRMRIGVPAVSYLSALERVSGPRAVAIYKLPAGAVDGMLAIERSALAVLLSLPCGPMIFRNGW